MTAYRPRVHVVILTVILANKSLLKFKLRPWTTVHGLFYKDLTLDMNLKDFKLIFKKWG